MANLTAAAPAIELARVSRRYEGGPVLRPLSLSVATGERVALLGPNGAGKTTLLRIIATLLRPTNGALRLFGADPQRDAAAIRARIGLVGHQTMLHPELTAAENLGYYAALYAMPDAAARVATALHAVGLESRAGSRVGAFSRGMLQRLALARALIHGPELLLLDEPDAGLDVRALDLLPSILARGERIGGMTAPPTVVFSTHQVERALALAQRALVLVAGRLVYDGPTGALSVAAVSAIYGGGTSGDVH